MFCVNCGNKLPENSRFCNMCGTDLSTRIAPPSQGAATSGGYSMPPQGGISQPSGYQPANGAVGPQGYSDTRSGQPAGFEQQGGWPARRLWTTRNQSAGRFWSAGLCSAGRISAARSIYAAGTHAARLWPERSFSSAAGLSSAGI